MKAVIFILPFLISPALGGWLSFFENLFKSTVVDGNWTDWGSWTECSKTCGNGTQAHTRNCTNPIPSGGGSTCEGFMKETKLCNNGPCPIAGLWGEWGNFSACSVTCGEGVTFQTRLCNNPAPQFGGPYCVGSDARIRSCTFSACPDAISFTNIDGNWGDWSEWDDCSESCDGGIQTRIRECNNPNPENGGTNCSESNIDTETKLCNEDPCPIDGGWGDWSEWDVCTAPCDGGFQTRLRFCVNPEPANGGLDCSEINIDSQTQECNEDPCPGDPYLSEWSEWDTCTLTCGGGTQTHNRTCIGEIPGVTSCNGMENEDNFEVRSCNEDPCITDSDWGEWSDWDQCTTTCGGGYQTKLRFCINPDRDCSATNIDSATQTCNEDLCPRDGGWGDWSDWDECTAPCDGGYQTRLRFCDNPIPDAGGSDCSDTNIDSETKTCNIDLCPTDGEWSEWSDWDNCTEICGGGNQTRTRTCSNPPPANGGNDCGPDDTEMQNCNEDPCVIDGEWSEWSDWETCTQSCGGGNQTRTRICSNPPPANGGNDCGPDDTEIQSCNEDPCVDDSDWGEWSEWDQCTSTCGGGYQTKLRFCINPDRDCSATNIDSATQTCNEGLCPRDGGWGNWSDWDECTSPCDGGYQTRLRFCDNPVPDDGRLDCSDTNIDSETQSCNIQPCPTDGEWSEWSDWDTCSQTCGGGNQTRTRNCTNPPPANGGNDCGPDDTEMQICNEETCVIDGEWSEWSDWDTCTQTCGGGNQTRTRTCTNPSPANGGIDCGPDDTEMQICNEDTCAIDGEWSEWSDWNTCTQTCGGGSQTRTRTCSNPPPANGGNDCGTDDTEMQNCNEGPCVIDGNWSDWSEWSACSLTCGKGFQLHNRSCNNPPPANGGQECIGGSVESKTCNKIKCPIDGKWSLWTTWTSCTAACGGGTKARIRDCTNPIPSGGGKFCTGPSTNLQTCNDDPCSYVAFLAGGLNSTDVEVYAPNGGCSKSLAPIPEEQKSPHLAFIHKDIFYCPSQNSQQCYIYDLESNSWIPYTSMSSLHSQSTSIVYDDLLYVADYSNAEYFDPTTKIWTTWPSYPTAIQSDACLTLRLNSFLLIDSVNLQTYDLETETWSSKPINPPSTIDDPACLTLPNNNILIVGSGGLPLLYDLANDTWDTLPPTINSQGKVTLLQLGQKYFIFGGNSSATVAQEFNYLNNTWSSVAGGEVTTTNSQGYVSGIAVTVDMFANLPGGCTGGILGRRKEKIIPAL